MKTDFIKELYRAHQECPNCPSQDQVARLFDELIGILFPVYAKQRFDSYQRFELHLLNLKEELYDILYLPPIRANIESDNAAEGFFNALPQLYQWLNWDIEAMYEGDPAAQSKEEVIRSYPGFYAIAAYRMANVLSALGVRIIPRMITEYAHSKTGIDIHPDATIGKYFCIDHGTGIVIGATTKIGDHVKIYQGVTLGALSVKKEDAAIKRHPTIEDRVVIYAEATILGGETVIGHDSIIGGNVWLTESLPPHSKIYYQHNTIGNNDQPNDTMVIKQNKK